MFSLVLSIFTRYIMTEGKELALLTGESISDIQENSQSCKYDSTLHDGAQRKRKEI